MSSAEPSALHAPVISLRGVGPERAVQLARLKIHTVGDLLLHGPHRYEDRRKFRKVAELELGEAATVRGRIVAQGVKRWRQRTRSVFEFVLEDGSGRLHCRWWNLPYLEDYFRPGDELLIYGKVCSLRPRTIDHPETEVIEAGEENFIHLNRLVPVYPLTEGLSQRWLRALVWHTLESHAALLAEPWPQSPPPDMPSRADAVRKLHFPEATLDVEQARRRLALDELLALQLEIQRRRRRLQALARGLPCASDNHLIKPFLKQLGFALTEAQTRVLREIRHDLGRRQPMRRLLQGDVGSGKTVVAACAALMALESGYNAALMAPTEILAEQHFETFRRWLVPLEVKVGLRTGSRKTSDKTDSVLLQSSIAHRQSPTLTVGTHALIEDGFAPEQLGLVIIDEQHKFGVAQREQLVRKGHYPHLLVMTATPIPRTLGLTLYGDLDISTIDQLPPGRGRVRTFLRRVDRLPKVWEFIRGKLQEGRQAYVVYPRIEESEGEGLKAVTKEWERLRQLLAPCRVGLLHGRLRPEEKDQVMNRFRARETGVLVTTSVIEVGIDVPNATVMLVEDADQFGLAQLHQLRGRIGRGAHESYCILVASLKTEDARRRLKVLEETSDGFRIAEEDLRLRGPGEMLGQQQSGLPSFHFANLAKDQALVEQARGLARRMVDDAGELNQGSLRG